MPTFTPRVVLLLLVVVVLVPLLPILVSGRWRWWEAWVYAGLWVAGFVVSRGWAARRHPDLLEERVRSLGREDTEPYDKILAPLVALGAVTIPLTAGLEARFRDATLFSPSVKAAALLLMVAGYALATWAMIENRYFSGTVRIQEERGHVVVDSGPYRFLRHPGYSGAVAGYMATPLLLDSPWAFLPAGLGVMAIVLRIVLEERTLRARLPGYAEYMQRTRARLVPGVW